MTVACTDPHPATPALEVNEGDGQTCTVVLDTRPAGDVTVSPTVVPGTPAGDGTDVDVSPASSLTFTATDWFAAPTITVRAATDDDDTATLRFGVDGYGTVTSARAVALVVLDPDTAGLTASPSSLTLHQGHTAAYTLELDTRPTAAVTVDVSGSAVAPSALTFTRST